ncbi:MAG: hypothetical protein E7673_04450 [Ruminococcaceae bacterium]|nr:hypothetical protein [Oscillospiraceae bacterium]
MTKKHSTKRALVASILALCMCFTMLIGTTFAWFTDSATSSGNVIKTGTLDVQLLMHNGTDYEDISENSSPIFGEGAIAQNNNGATLWEPGKTQVAYLAIKNNGSLALKYTVALNVANVANDLYEVMDYEIVPDAKPGDTLDLKGGAAVVEGNQSVSGDVSLAVGAIHYFALAIHMDENAGNDYQDGQVNFSLSVLATQDTAESDSFGNQYDKDAFYGVTNEAELVEALSNGGNVKIANDMVIDDTVEVKAPTTIDLNGQNLDVKAIKATEDLTIIDSGEIAGTPVTYQDPATIIVENGATVTLNDVKVSTNNWGSYGENQQTGESGGEMFAIYITNGDVVLNNCDLVIKEPIKAVTYATAYGVIIENGTFTMNGGSISADASITSPFAIAPTLKNATDKCVINLNGVDIKTQYTISLVGYGTCIVNLTNGTNWNEKWTYKAQWHGTYELNK